MLFSNLALGIKTILPHFRHFMRMSMPTLKISHSSEPQGCFFSSLQYLQRGVLLAKQSPQLIFSISKSNKLIHLQTLLTKLCIIIFYCNISMRIWKCNFFLIKYFFYPISYLPLNFPLLHRLCFCNNSY